MQSDASLVRTNSRLFLGVTALMLVAFGVQGIKSIDDLSACATDDLHGRIENRSGNVTE